MFWRVRCFLSLPFARATDDVQGTVSSLLCNGGVLGFLPNVPLPARVLLVLYPFILSEPPIHLFGVANLDERMVAKVNEHLVLSEARNLCFMVKLLPEEMGQRLVLGVLALPLRVKLWKSQGWDLCHEKLGEGQKISTREFEGLFLELLA